MKSNPALDRCVAILAIAGLALLAVMGSFDSASAQSRRDGKRDEFGQSRAAGAPLFAVVALGDQRVTIYDAEGKILQSPVSTGATGYETPPAYSVVQKKAVHSPMSTRTATCPSCSASRGRASPFTPGAAGPARLARLRAPAARVRPAPLRPDRYRPARDRGARYIAQRHCPPALFKPNPARRGVPATPPSLRPPAAKRQDKSWRRIVRERHPFIARHGQPRRS